MIITARRRGDIIRMVFANNAIAIIFYAWLTSHRRPRQYRVRGARVMIVI